LIWRKDRPGETADQCGVQIGRYIMFKANVGGLDRILRVILGLGLIAIVFVGPQTPWGWVGVVPLLTGLFGTCPLYSLLGFRTSRRVGGRN
jgi:hypothetical protein